MQDLADRLDRLDLSLFSHAPSQSTDGDKQSWLAVQRAIRAEGYSYLEIGSYLGGSIQQHVVDPLCQSIASIDNRPLKAPDSRGSVEYHNNSTELMLKYLNAINSDGTKKIKTFECNAAKMNVRDLPMRADYCFIDGEHTNSAVASDFAFCLQASAPNAAICLHDARIIHPAIRKILSELGSSGVKFSAGRLAGDTFGIFLGNCKAASDPFIQKYLGNSETFFRHMRIRHAIKAIMPRQIHSAMKALFPAP